jgi:3-carboxy-cis,cis-muconate cycloisomerase
MSVNPADSVVFGTLYGTDPMRAVFDDRSFVMRMVAVEAALARVQGRLGVIPIEAAAAIDKAAASLEPDLAKLALSTAKVGVPVVGVVAQLRAASGAASGSVHWGATTQDIMDTALVLQLQDAMVLLEADLARCIAALALLADKHRASVMPGRTHLQHALPITFGLKAASWLQPLLGHAERLAQLRPRVLRVQFGGAVGTLASLGTEGVVVMEALAAELGLAAPPAPWHTARDGVAELACYLGLLAGSLGKIATDVVLQAQSEVGELAEPHEAGRGGSSTMPQKRNPISSEYILSACRGVQALVPLMLGAMLQDHERATGPWQSEMLALPQACTLAHGALVRTRALLEGLQVDPAKMRANIDITHGAIMAEAAMMGLAPLIGNDEAHHLVQHACDDASREGVGLAEVLARDDRVDPAVVARLTDPTGYLGVTEALIDRVLAATSPDKPNPL